MKVQPEPTIIPYATQVEALARHVGEKAGEQAREAVLSQLMNDRDRRTGQQHRASR
jgi:hypothetical protein